MRKLTAETRAKVLTMLRNNTIAAVQRILAAEGVNGKIINVSYITLCDFAKSHGIKKKRGRPAGSAKNHPITHGTIRFELVGNGLKLDFPGGQQLIFNPAA